MEDTATTKSDELPEGFHWEYRTGDDGGGNWSHAGSETWPSTRYRRAVGPWVVDRPGGRDHAMRRGPLKGFRGMSFLAILGVLLFAGSATASAHARRCVVPQLRGVSLHVAKHRLHAHGCELGKVYRPKHAGPYIVRTQSPRVHAHRRYHAKVRVWLKVKSAKAQVTATPVTITAPTLTAPPSTPPVVRAGIDPNYVQDSADNLRVTWTYSASAGAVSLPDGVLSFSVTPATGGLAPVGGCSINVDATTTSGTCTIELSSYGSFQTTVTYAGAGSTVAPSTQTATDTIEPLPLTVTRVWGTDDNTTPSIATTVIGSVSDVTLTDANFEGATSVGITDTTGGSCTATVTGTTANCTMTDSSTPVSYSIAYPGGNTTTTSQNVAPNGVQSVTTEWPAQTVVDATPAVTVQQATVIPCGDAYVPPAQSRISTMGECQTLGQAIPWTTNLTTNTGQNVWINAAAIGTVAGDSDPYLQLVGSPLDSQVSGYLTYTVTGGVQGTDYYAWNGESAPDASVDCSKVLTQPYDSTTNTYGTDAPEGSCELRFLTAGTYTISASYTSLDANYPNEPNGPSTTVTVLP